MLIEIFLTVGLTVAFTIAWALYAKFSYRPAKPDSQGRIMIKPGPMSWLFGVLGVALFVMFCFATFDALYVGEDEIFWLVLGPPLMFLSGFGAYVIFWPRIRASELSLEYRGLKGWQGFEWDEVSGIYTNSMLGPRIKLVSGQVFPLWTYGYGSVEMAELFLSKEKFFET